MTNDGSFVDNYCFKRVTTMVRDYRDPILSCCPVGPEKTLGDHTLVSFDRFIGDHIWATLRDREF